MQERQEIITEGEKYPDLSPQIIRQLESHITLNENSLLTVVPILLPNAQSLESLRRYIRGKQGKIFKLTYNPQWPDRPVGETGEEKYFDSLEIGYGYLDDKEKEKAKEKMRNNNNLHFPIAMLDPDRDYWLQPTKEGRKFSTGLVEMLKFMRDNHAEFARGIVLMPPAIGEAEYIRLAEIFADYGADYWSIRELRVE